MPFIYTDNESRISRAKELANTINERQVSIKKTVERMEKRDKRVIEGLEKFASENGFATLKDLQEKALAALSKEDREKYVGMETKGIPKGEKLEQAHSILWAAIGITGTPIVTWGVVKAAKLFTALARRYMFKGVVRIFEGAVEIGMALIKAAIAALRSIISIGARGGERAITAAVDAGAAGMKSAGILARLGLKFGPKTARFLKIGGGLAFALSVVVEGVILVVEEVQAKEQMEELRELISDLVPRRWAVTRMDLLTFATDSCWNQMQADVKSEIRRAKQLATKRMTDEEYKEEKNEEIEEFSKLWDTEHAAVTDDRVNTDLAELDEISVWTKDDPKMPAIKAWLEKHKEFNPQMTSAGALKANQF